MAEDTGNGKDEDEPGEAPGYGQPLPGDWFDDDFAPRKKTSPLSRRPATEHILPAAVIFAVCALLSIMSWRGSLPVDLVAGTRTVFADGEYWRLLTSMFLHSGPSHLLSNGWLLLIFGWLLRDYFGFFAFPFLALCTGIFANYMTLWMTPHPMRLIGASGMVYGMLALWIVGYIRYDIRHTIPMRIFRALGFCLIMLLPTTIQPRVSYQAHAWGFLAGFILAVLLAGWLPVRRPTRVTMPSLDNHH